MWCIFDEGSISLLVGMILMIKALLLWLMIIVIDNHIGIDSDSYILYDINIDSGHIILVLTLTIGDGD